VEPISFSLVNLERNFILKYSEVSVVKLEVLLFQVYDKLTNIFRHTYSNVHARSSRQIIYCIRKQHEIFKADNLQKMSTKPQRIRPWKLLLHQPLCCGRRYDATGRVKNLCNQGRCFVAFENYKVEHEIENLRRMNYKNFKADEYEITRIRP